MLKFSTYSVLSVFSTYRTSLLLPYIFLFSGVISLQSHFQSQSHASITYRPELDGLRGLSVLLVIFFHAGASFIGGGFLGVDIFFVISGYLIGAIAIRETSQGRFSIGSFLERRLRRILPALFVLCILCILPAWLLLPPSDLKDFSESLLGNAISVNNYLFLSQAGYFDRASEMKPLLHTWSLSVEIQFYLSVAFLMLMRKKYTIKAANYVVILAALCSFIAYCIVSNKNSDLSFYVFPLRIWEFMFGVGIALFLTQRNLTSTWPSVLGFASIGFSVLAYNWIFFNQALATFIVVFGAAMIILSAANGGFINRLLANKILVFTGAISYSLYLFHNPILSFSRYVNLEHNMYFLVVAGLGLMFISYMSWRFIEGPCRNKNAFPRPYFIGLCLLFFICTLMMYLVTDKTEGFLDQRLNQQQQEMMLSAVRDTREKSCQTGGDNFRPPDDACVLYGEEAGWAIFGDSHAGATATALSKKISETTKEASQWLSMRGCPPANIEAPTTACEKWTKTSIDWLNQQQNIHTVLVVFRLNVYFWGSQVNAYPNLAEEVSIDQREQLWTNYRNIILALKKGGKKVVIIQPIPEPRQRIGDLIYSEGKVDKSIAATKSKWWDIRNEYSLKKLSTLPKDILQFDSKSVFCDEHDCYAVKDLQSYYYDHNHLSRLGADLLSEQFMHWYDAVHRNAIN